MTPILYTYFSQVAINKQNSEIHKTYFKNAFFVRPQLFKLYLLLSGKRDKDDLFQVLEKGRNLVESKDQLEKH